MVKSKRGISIMIGYVLLISMVLVIGTLIFAWARTLIPQDKLECPEGSSLVVKGIRCDGGQLRIDLYNNGKRNIDDIFFKGKTDGNRELANLDLSDPDAGGLVALIEAGAMSPGGSQILDSKFYDESCVGIGGECGTDNICAGTFDCNVITTKPNRQTICENAKNNLGLNCDWVPNSPTLDDGECIGIDTCNKLQADVSNCPLSYLDYGCSLKNNLRNYQLFEIEITPERQQEDKNGKKVPVVCGDAIIKQQLDNCLIYPVCGDAVVQTFNGEDCDDGNDIDTDTCP